MAAFIPQLSNIITLKSMLLIMKTNNLLQTDHFLYEIIIQILVILFRMLRYKRW